MTEYTPVDHRRDLRRLSVRRRLSYKIIRIQMRLADLWSAIVRNSPAFRGRRR